MKVKAELKTVSIELLKPSPYQTRRDFEPVALQELADSIAKQGILQPILVRQKADYYEIIAGERRWRAAQLASLYEVPCLCNQFDDEQAAAATTIENVQREDLNPIEEAQAYQRLIDEFHYRQEDVAVIVGKSRVNITHSLRLLKLDARVQDLLIQGTISEGHGKVLASVSTTQQFLLAQQCVQHQWSVRRLEQSIKQQACQADKKPHSSQIKFVERQIAEQLGAEVQLDEEKEQSGWLKIRYYNPETLEGLLAKMGVTLEAD